MAWFLTVWWPLAVGVLVGGLTMRIYTDDSGVARPAARDDRDRLSSSAARSAALTGREIYSVFTVVALVMLSLLMFGWRFAGHRVPADARPLRSVTRPGTRPAPRRVRHDDLRRDVGAGRRAPASINLGQGFPDTDGPRRGRSTPRSPPSAPATTSTRPAPASPSCAQAIADHQQRFYGLDRRPRHRGARHRRAPPRRSPPRCSRCASRATRSSPSSRPTTPTRACIAMAGARPARRSRSRTPDFAFDLDALARRHHARAPGCCCSTRRTTRPARCSPATSSPPIAALCVEHDLVAVTDEVYEHLVFDGEHVPLATLPGHGASARSRSPRPARRSRSPAGRSAGCAGRAELVAAVRTAKQFLTYVNGAPFQPAVAVGLGLPRRRTSPSFARRPAGQARPAVRRAGRAPASTVFAPAGHVLRHRRRPRRSARTTASRSAGRCPSAAAWWPSRASVFYDDPAAGRTLVRFAFCKRPEVLAEAVERLATLA